MDVILLERIDKLGQMGDVVSVKPGYARNYLLPKNKAVTASKENKTHFETQRAQLEAQSLERKSDAESVGTKMAGTIIILVRQAGDTGQLYGSVNARDIANALAEAGYTTNRNQVRLVTPIKTVGLHEISISLHPEVTVTVNVNVARSEEEAKIQEQTGEAIISAEVDEVPLVDEALMDSDAEEEIGDNTSQDLDIQETD